MVSKDDDGALQILYFATQVRAFYSLKHSFSFLQGLITVFIKLAPVIRHPNESSAFPSACNEYWTR